MNDVAITHPGDVCRKGLTSSKIAFVSISEPMQPFLYIGCHVRYGFGCSFMDNCKSIGNHNSIRFQLLNRIGGAGKTATSVDIKWNDRLAGEIVFVKETVHHLG